MWWSAKNDKTRNPRFYDLRIVGYKKYKTKIWGIKNLFSLLKFYKMSFLLPYNSKIIKSPIFHFSVLSRTPHLPILPFFNTNHGRGSLEHTFTTNVSLVFLTKIHAMKNLKSLSVRNYCCKCYYCCIYY